MDSAGKAVLGFLRCFIAALKRSATHKPQFAGDLGAGLVQKKKTPVSAEGPRSIRQGGYARDQVG
jgi:hypothetical protein